MPIKEDGSGGDWNKARLTRLAWLTNENIKAKYLANPNPEGIASWSEDRAIQLYGLPMSYPEKHGPFVTQRFQRVAFQLWVDEVEGMPAVGTVVRVLGGDLLKEACLVPSQCAGAGGKIQLRLIDDHAAEVYASPSVLDIYTAWVVIGFTAAAF